MKLDVTDLRSFIKSKFEILRVYTIRLSSIGIRKFEFVAKTQFLYEFILFRCVVLRMRVFIVKD